MKKKVTIIITVVMLALALSGCGTKNPLKGTTWYIDRMPGTITFDQDTFTVTNIENGVSKSGEYVLYTGDEAAQIAEVDEDTAREELQNYEDEYVALVLTIEGNTGKAIGFMGKDKALVVVDGYLFISAEKM